MVETDHPKIEEKREKLNNVFPSDERRESAINTYMLQSYRGGGGENKSDVYTCVNKQMGELCV